MRMLRMAGLVSALLLASPAGSQEAEHEPGSRVFALTGGVNNRLGHLKKAEGEPQYFRQGEQFSLWMENRDENPFLLAAGLRYESMRIGYRRDYGGDLLPRLDAYHYIGPELKAGVRINRSGKFAGTLSLSGGFMTGTHMTSRFDSGNTVSKVKDLGEGEFSRFWVPCDVSATLSKYITGKLALTAKLNGRFSFGGPFSSMLYYPPLVAGIEGGISYRIK